MGMEYLKPLQCGPDSHVIGIGTDNGWRRVVKDWGLQFPTRRSCSKITATCARVPVFNSHSESVNIETERKLTAVEAVEILSKSAGVKVFAGQEGFPTSAEVSGCDETFVGRIREDNTIANGLNLWIVADNILKGAALNAVQIAEHIIRG